MSDSATEYDKLFIGGKWTKPSTSDVIEVRCPATGEYVGKVPMAAAPTSTPRSPQHVRRSTTAPGPRPRRTSVRR